MAEKLVNKLHPLLKRVLAGETVEVGVFLVWEDYLYQRKRDRQGNPMFRRVLSLIYFDEEDEDTPSHEDFDGTLESFLECLDAHDAFEEEDQ